MAIKLKSKEEIEILREGGRRHANILGELALLVIPGVSTLTLENEARRLVSEAGGKPAFLNYTPKGAKRPFPAALCVSLNDEIVHGIPNEVDRIIHEGDIVSLDLGFVYRGLITDSAVTVPCGEVDDEARELIRISKLALARGCEVAKVGARIGDIGFAVNSALTGTKFSLAKDLSGHGVGYKVHEDPYVPNIGKSGEGEPLTSGMVIAIEPMVNAGKPDIKVSSDGYTIKTRDGSRSAHFEHTVAITEEGNIILTQ